jgi:hypothetical protein
MSELDETAGAAPKRTTPASAEGKLASRLASLDEGASPEVQRKAAESAAESAKGAPDQFTEILQADTDERRGEVSAVTIGRMLGLVTSGELKLLEGKLDLITTRLGALIVKVDRVVNTLGTIPTGADMERIDVQIGALRSMIRTLTEDGAEKKAEAKGRDSQEGKGDPDSGLSAAVRLKIRSNKRAEEGEAEEED